VRVTNAIVKIALGIRPHHDPKIRGTAKKEIIPAIYPGCLTIP
jgi:hypothetical protein